MKRIIILIVILLVLAACHKQVKEEPNVFYTCSMDPQVMEKKPGKCPICKMELVRTVISPDQEKGSLKLSESQIQLANITTEEMGYNSINQGISLRGTIVPDERKTTVISSRVSGRIEKLYFKTPGEAINSGDRMYEIYSEELQSAINQYLLVKTKADQLDQKTINYQQMLSAAEDELLISGMTEQQINKLQPGSPSDLISFYSKTKGVVTDVMVGEGDYVEEGSPILKIADYSTLWVQAEAYPGDLKLISSDSKVKIAIESYPNEIVEGKISFENPELEPQSKISLVRIEISNPTVKYKPGMRATVILEGDTKKALSIPNSAILYQPEMNMVWVMDKEGTFSPRMVDLGAKDEDRTEVLSGIEEGDQIVISGAYLLNSEYTLRNGSSMADMPGMDMGNMQERHH